jgi:ADP-ribose pyrophosphatase YjhB (NUDIX family)
MFIKPVLKIWRELPSWLQLGIARLVRPSYRVAVAAIIPDSDGRILLCRHTYRKAYPWGLPSGSLEYGEDPQDGIIREVREETGLEVVVERLLLAESAREDHHVSLIYSCRVMGGQFQENLETSQTQFFPVNHLPDLLPTEKDLIRRLGNLGVITLLEDLGTPDGR